MSAGFCLHCGLKLDDTVDGVGVAIHSHCFDAWSADQARIARTPKSSIDQQLDRIEEGGEHNRLLLAAIINALPGTILFRDGKS